VSIATVSRVLNVAPETRERVLAGIREHDFAPARAARSLVTGRTELIGVILETGAGHPDLQHPFFQEVLVGLKHTVGDVGYDLLLFSVESAHGNGGSGTHRYLARARQHRVDGMVVMGADRYDAQVEELAASGIPTIAVDLDLHGGRCGYVTSDNIEGAALAVQHLADLGHRRIAMIGGPVDTRPGLDRTIGYRHGLERAGIEAREGYERVGDFYPESGRTEMAALLDLEEPPTAVFAAADLMAVGAIQAIEERDLSCPDDVAVVGFDDVQIAGLLRPALTTIRQDKPGLGAAAGGALVRMIEDPELAPPTVTVPVELVVRASSGGGLTTARPRDAGATAPEEGTRLS
jgi:LacI family transcriptional regulator, galactose operon repressor